MGLKLADFWTLEEHKLGELSFTHFPDGTAHKNRMQGNDFVQSLMYTRGVTCFSCHDPHGSENPAMLRATGNALCLTCHGPNTQTGPHAATIEAHTHHKPDSTGSACAACHMPAIEHTLERRVRARAYVPLRHSGRDRRAEDPERLHPLPHRQKHRLGHRGAARLGRSLAVADGAVAQRSARWYSRFGIMSVAAAMRFERLKKAMTSERSKMSSLLRPWARNASRSASSTRCRAAVSFQA